CDLVLRHEVLSLNLRRLRPESAACLEQQAIGGRIRPGHLVLLQRCVVPFGRRFWRACDEDRPAWTIERGVGTEVRETIAAVLNRARPRALVLLCRLPGHVEREVSRRGLRVGRPAEVRLVEQGWHRQLVEEHAGLFLRVCPYAVRGKKPEPIALNGTA